MKRKRGARGEIARRYRWHARNGRRPFSMAALRISQLSRLYSDRYGDTLPDDDAGRDDARLALHHLAKLSNNPARRMAVWLAVWCPWMPKPEREDLVTRILAFPLRYTADKLAAKLGLTAADRSRLKITTIGAIDENREQRFARQKERRRLAQEARRRAKGAKPRAVYLAELAGRSTADSISGCAAASSSNSPPTGGASSTPLKEAEAAS